VVIPSVGVDRDYVARYARICGFAVTDALPVTYPHLLAFGAQVHLMTTQPFPFPLLGLVHLRQQITQHRPLTAEDRPRVRVWAERLTPHAKGASVDLLAALDVAGEPVWHGRSTYLARGARVPVVPEGSVPEPPPQPRPLIGPPTATWRVPADTGRRYAAVSGDVNPIHLSALSARALGFPRAIAHGMWTAARTAAALAPRLPAAVSLDVVFASPVLLPATLAVLTAPVDGGAGGYDVAVRSRSMERLHLSATVRPEGPAASPTTVISR